MADEHVFTQALEEYNQKYQASIQSLKKLQKETLQSVLSNDTVSVLPTGYGKSLVYEILPIIYNKIHDKPAFLIIIVPLNVILKQQLDKFGDKAVNLSIIHKHLSQNSEERKKLLEGHYTYIFTHPEHIIDQKPVIDILLHKHFQEDVKTFVIIDEAHCILDWGTDFRPTFQKIHKLRAVLPGATFLAMTATLSLKGQSDIVRLLAMENHKVVSTYPARDNITLIVTKRPVISGATPVRISVDYCIEPLVMELLEKGQDFPLTIVYFSGSQDWVGVSFEHCKSILGPKFYHGAPTDDSARVVMYHASLEKDSDLIKQTIMTNLAMDPSESPLKMVLSTVALGMGADLTHVKRVIQISPPKTMEAYVQQIGRSGRSGEQSIAVLYYNNSDVGRPEVVEEMKDFCKSDSVCRRKMVNSSFGYSDYPTVPVDVCCDICNPDLRSEYSYEDSRLLKCTLRNTILSYIANDNTGFLRRVLSSSTIEQIACQPQKFFHKDTLKEAFTLDDSVITALSTIISTALHLHTDESSTE